LKYDINWSLKNRFRCLKTTGDNPLACYYRVETRSRLFYKQNALHLAKPGSIMQLSAN